MDLKLSGKVALVMAASRGERWTRRRKAVFWPGRAG